jgi:ankyrin repeat protein
VRLLLDGGADVNAKARQHGATDDTPVRNAARFGKTEVARLLLAGGADLHTCLGDGDYRARGFTPLHVAARGGHRETVELAPPARRDARPLRRHGAPE